MVKKPVREHADANMTTRVLVRDIMNSPVVSALPNDTIRDIAKKMKEEKIGSIVIMEKDKSVGIVTDWDIVSNGLIKDVKPSQIKAKDVMQSIHMIEGEESITEAARQLRKRAHSPSPGRRGTQRMTPPISGVASTRCTRRNPRLPRTIAHSIPAGPAPTTSTSLSAFAAGSKRSGCQPRRYSSPAVAFCVQPM